MMTVDKGGRLSRESLLLGTASSKSVRRDAMRAKNIKGVGHVKDWPEGLRTAKLATVARFLRYTLEQYARFSVECHRASGDYDFPLCYGEWENQPILWHCMRQVKRYGAVPFAEQFYRRKRRGKARSYQNQRLDYLVLLRDKTSETALWVEYKHRIAYLNRQERVRDLAESSLIGLGAIGKDWASDEKKLSGMTTDQYRDLWPSAGGRRPVKVNLLIMPICRRAEKDVARADIERDRDRLEGMRGTTLFGWVDRVSGILADENGACVNWKAAWVLDRGLQKRIQWYDDGDGDDTWSDYFYGVFFFAYLWSD